MADRNTKNSRRKVSGKAGRVPFSMIFWMLFFIGLIIIFFTFLPRVKKEAHIPQRQTDIVQVEQPPVSEQNTPPKTPPPAQTPQKPPAEKPMEKTPTTPAVEKAPPQKPAEQPPISQAPRQQPVTQPPPPAEKPVETRDRSIYFMQEGHGGAGLALVKVNRKLAVSNSPLMDSINALLAGPSAEERQRGLLDFIPANTRLLSARVNNNTVFLNFNEGFRYNPLGREGCEAQLKQIVWTATEFPNVHNVQIEIEGNIVDFLIEGIMIRNPIGR